MRKQILLIIGAVLVCSATLLSTPQALRTNIKVPLAGVRGRITIDEVVGKSVQSNPIPRLKLYLLRVEDSRPLVQLQESCRHATADPNANPLRSFRTCDEGLRQAVKLVPTLPLVATAETDRNGQYEFPEVPAAGRYNVVGVQTVEGAEPIVMVGITNRLRAGERVTLNLSANDPWTRSVTP